MIDGNDIWEALFGIMKGNVPEALTEDVLEQLATALHTPDPAGVSEMADELAGSVVFDERANVSEIGSWVRARKERILAALRTPSPVLEVAKEALEPFVRALNCWGDVPEQSNVGDLTVSIGLGDLQRARAALQTINERTEQ